MGVSSPGHRAEMTERGRARCFSFTVAALESSWDAELN